MKRARIVRRGGDVDREGRIVCAGLSSRRTIDSDRESSHCSGCPALVDPRFAHPGPDSPILSFTLRPGQSHRANCRTSRTQRELQALGDRGDAAAARLADVPRVWIATNELTPALAWLTQLELPPDLVATHLQRLTWPYHRQPSSVSSLLVRLGVDEERAIGRFFICARTAIDLEEGDHGVYFVTADTAEMTEDWFRIFVPRFEARGLALEIPRRFGGQALEMRLETRLINLARRNVRLTVYVCARLELNGHLVATPKSICDVSAHLGAPGDTQLTRVSVQAATP